MTSTGPARGVDGLFSIAPAGPNKGLDGWSGSGAWVMRGWVSGYSTGSVGVPACPLALII